MAWRENFKEKFYRCKTKCRLKNEVLVLTMVQFILSILLDLVAIGLVFGLKLPSHSSILLTITLSLRILSSMPIIVASFWAIRKPNERCILALWIQCCITCGIIQISTMSNTICKCPTKFHDSRVEHNFDIFSLLHHPIYCAMDLCGL